MVLSKLFVFIAGMYAGAYLDQNYRLPKLPSPQEMERWLMSYLET
jgi:hypothetical protein